MYFIMEKETEITVAMSHYEDVANFIATTLPCTCVVRYVDLGSITCKYKKCFLKKENDKEIA